MRRTRTGMRAALVAALVTLAAIGSVVGAEAAEPEVEPIDLNTADEQTLQSVPGIGPALAKRIVEFREKEGPFTRVDDLLKIRGIGEKSLAKIRPYVRVGRQR